MSAARCAARIQRTLARKEQVLEEKRTAVLAAEEAAERRLQQKLEVSLGSQPAATDMRMQ